MSVSETLATVEKSLDEISELAPNSRLQVVPDLIRARGLLDQSEPVAGPEELPWLQKLRQRYEQLAAPIANSMQRSLSKTLYDLKNGSAPRENGQSTSQLSQVQEDLSSVLELFPNRAPQLEQLRSEVDDLESKVISEEELQRLVQTVEEIWQQAARAEADSPEQALLLGKKALDELRAAEQRATSWRNQEQIGLRIRIDKAQRLYDDLRNRHEVPVTKQEGDQLVALVLDFMKWDQEDPTRRVTYFSSAERTAVSQAMTVREALVIARRRLQNIFWREKIIGYIAEAEKALETDHRPDQAEATLHLWTQIPGMNDPELNLPLADVLVTQIKQMQDRITPELERYRAAEQLIAQARLEQKTDIIKAFASLEAAEAKFPTHESLQQLRADLIEKAGVVAAQLLEEADSLLEQESWELCNSRLGSIEQLRNKAEIKGESEVKFYYLQSILNRVLPVTPSRRFSLTAEAELERLEGLANEFPELWEGWKSLATRLSELNARSDISRLLAEVDRACSPSQDADVLGSLLRDCQGIHAAWPAGATSQDQVKVIQAIERLKAWIGFVHARDELQKVAKIEEADSATYDFDLSSTPDLRVARAGLDEAARDRDAQKAVLGLGLREKLAQLEREDPVAKSTLDRLRQPLNTTDSEGLLKRWREVRQTCSRWLRKATSYRNEFLELRRDATLHLREALTAQLQQLLHAAYSQYYTTLDVSSIRTLHKELVELPGLSSEDPQKALTSQVETALAMADAHRQVESARKGHGTWEYARSSWEQALQKTDGDETLRNYSLRQVKEAWKQGEIKRATQPGVRPAEAEQLLFALCQDPILSQDWEVWYKHADLCAGAAKSITRRTLAADDEARDYLDKASTSLAHANHLVNNDTVAPKNRASVAALTADLEPWKTLLQAMRSIGVLDLWSVGDLTADTCREKQSAFIAANGETSVGEAKSLLAQFWDAQRKGAREKLKRQLTRASTIFDRVDAWLAIMILFPEDPAARAQLLEIVHEAVRQLQIEVGNVINDHSARAFLARAMHSANPQAPENREVVSLQIVEVQETIAKVHTLKSVLSMLAHDLGNDLVGANILDQVAQQTKEWEKELRELERQLKNAEGRAQLGLENPEHFEVAKYILRDGGTTVVGVVPVPAAFKEQAHPSYQASKAVLNELINRRTRQEALQDYIHRCLKYERVTTLQELPGPDSLKEEREKQLIRTLDEKMRSNPGWYPVHYTLQLMTEMVEHDSGDSCLLQVALRYLDPDSQTQYVTLTRIRAVIEAKVAQLSAFRDWLSTLVAMDSTDAAGHPTIVAWNEARASIENERDSGPEGLVRALALTRGVLLGDSTGRHEGKIALQVAYESLAYDKLVAHLRKAANLDPSASINLYKLSQKLEERRQAEEERYRQQVLICKQIEADIRWRMEQFDRSWREFDHSYSELYRMRRGWHGSRQHQRFEAAARQFYRITPRYSEFQTMLKEIEETKGIVIQGDTAEPERRS